MQPGNLVRVRMTSTGDNPWVVKLYRERTPVLIIKIDREFAWILDIDGKQKLLTKRVLDVIS